MRSWVKLVFRWVYNRLFVLAIFESINTFCVSVYIRVEVGIMLDRFICIIGNSLYADLLRSKTHINIRVNNNTVGVFALGVGSACDLVALPKVWYYLPRFLAHQLL